MAKIKTCEICSREICKNENYVEIARSYYICEECFKKIFNQEEKYDTEGV